MMVLGVWGSKEGGAEVMFLRRELGRRKESGVGCQKSQDPFRRRRCGGLWIVDRSWRLAVGG